MGISKLINVYSCSEGISIDQVSIPSIFYSPIRTDIIQFVHQSMSKNKRQPYSVSPRSGMKTSASSWGTGRAVARVPRVPGSGTHRSGQGAIANFCRGGRIFAPTKIWRKWHHKINKNQRRQAIISAIASTGILSLIIARGHNISRVPEIPLVLENASESMVKTKDALKSLANIGVIHDILTKKKKQKIRETPIEDVRKYLIKKGLIRVGSSCPNDVLRKMHESSMMMCGDIQNHNPDNLLYNYLHNGL